MKVARTGGPCGEVNNGDSITLDFSEKMKSAVMGTVYHVVIAPDGVIRLYKGEIAQAQQIWLLP